MKHPLIVVLVSLALLLLSRVAQALDTYTDRSQWEANTKGLLFIEDLESEIVGMWGTPYSTNAGFGVETPGFGVIIQVQDNGLVNGSRDINLKDVGNRFFFSFPDARAEIAFGFDWATGTESWMLKVGQETIALPGGANGFVGIVDDAGELAGFELTSIAVLQDGLDIDDLSYNPSLILFADRSEWEGMIETPDVESFEQDAIGVHQTPYSTTGGCSVQSLGSANDVEISAPGAIDGSRELKLHDQGNELAIGFPGGAVQAGFGFDWKTGIQVWTLKIRQEQITLAGQSDGFFGVVDQTGLLDSFLLNPATINHDAVNIDNLAYSGQTVPTRPVTWGGLKWRYRD